jgi:hypothetical protein
VTSILNIVPIIYICVVNERVHRSYNDRALEKHAKFIRRKGYYVYCIKLYGEYIIVEDKCNLYLYSAGLKTKRNTHFILITRWVA